MEIRKLKHNERDPLLDLYIHAHDRDDPIPDETVLSDVWGRIYADENHNVLGVFMDGQLVSSCVLCIIPNLTRGCRPYGLIENVVTHSGFRRQGLGNSLLKHALDYAWQLHCYKVMLLTGRKDEGIYRFYESAGFDRDAKQGFLAKNL